MSVDGKISSGSSDSLDPDQDWKCISGVAEELSQYYQIEQTTDLYNLNTGRVMAKIGMDSRKDILEKRRLPSLSLTASRI
jgi:2,5-diamino-6-(ribosylamino)-4(3H)-pyrimidinone 5'-phosphate reductase